MSFGLGRLGAGYGRQGGGSKGGVLGPRIQLSAATIAENSTAGISVGTFSVSNSTGVYTFSLTDTAGSRFKSTGATGSALETSTVPTDYETETSHIILASATTGGAAITRYFTISVTDVAEGGGDVGSPMGLLLALTKAA